MLVADQVVFSNKNQQSALQLRPSLSRETDLDLEVEADSGAGIMAVTSSNGEALIPGGGVLILRNGQGDEVLRFDANTGKLSLLNSAGQETVVLDAETGNPDHTGQVVRR